MLNRKMFRWPLVSILCIIFVFVMATWIMNIQSNNIQNSPGFRISIFLVAFLIIGIIVKKFIINKIDPQMEAFKKSSKKQENNKDISKSFFENVTGKKDLKGNKKSNKKNRDNVSNLLKNTSTKILENENTKSISNFFKDFGKNNSDKEIKEKICPYCAETIKFNAKKCRFCGEWLVEK